MYRLNRDRRISTTITTTPATTTTAKIETTANTTSVTSSSSSSTPPDKQQVVPSLANTTTNFSLNNIGLTDVLKEYLFSGCLSSEIPKAKVPKLMEMSENEPHVEEVVKSENIEIKIQKSEEDEEETVTINKKEYMDLLEIKEKYNSIKHKFKEISSLINE